MRTTTAPELTTLAAATRRITHRVKVKNGSGTWIDLSSWVESASEDHDIDQPVAGLTVAFRRDSGITQSLSPLRTDSTLNRLDNGVTYSPQLDVNREITYEVATTAIGAAVVAGDYKLRFVGSIDTVAFEQSPVVVICRDQGGLLVDRWIEVEEAYGSVVGEPLEDVMQEVLDDTLTSGFVPLNVLGLPTWPAFDVSPAYVQQRQPMMEAQTALAQLPGGDVRYRYDEASATFKFTLHEPPRSKTTPDHTFGPSTYIEVTRLELDLTNVKNVITVKYPDLAAGGHLSVTVFDAASITKYGRRYFFVQEPTGSPINTSAQATAMADAMLWDMKDPKAEFEIDMPFFWPADLWDLYRFTNNVAHFDTNQDWAVVSFTHSLSKSRHRTKLQVRGLPAGAYHAWRGRTNDPWGGRPGEVGPEAHIEEMGGSTNPGVENILYYGTGGTQPYTYERRIDIDTISTGTWSAPAALGSGVTEWVPVDPYHPTRIYLRVTDATGLIGNADPFSLMGDFPAVDKTTGAIDADQVDDGAVRRAVAFALLPAGTQAKTLIISSAAFIAISGATTWVNAPDGLQTNTGSGSFLAFAPLPQGVTITKIEMWSKNPTGGGSTDVVLRLYRQSASAFGSATLIATATRTAVASDGGGMDASSTVSEVVSTNTYVLRLDLGDNLDMFLNALVYYTMPSYDKTL